jgi:hypothetical protein
MDLHQNQSSRLVVRCPSNEMLCLNCLNLRAFSIVVYNCIFLCHFKSDLLLNIVKRLVIQVKTVRQLRQEGYQWSGIKTNLVLYRCEEGIFLLGRLFSFTSFRLSKQWLYLLHQQWGHLWPSVFDETWVREPYRYEAQRYASLSWICGYRKIWIKIAWWEGRVKARVQYHLFKT